MRIGTRKGFTLIELMIVIAIIAVIAAIAIPGLLAAQRASNERNASASLKTVGTAEADIRSNDRDNNLLNDFWTADLAGLHIVVAAAPGGGPGASLTINDAIKLIEVSLAMADGNCMYGIEYTSAAQPSTVWQSFQPKAGYWFSGLVNDQTGGAAAPLRVDTDGAGVAAYTNAHNNDRFSYCALPTSLSSGRLGYILNQENTIFKINLAATYALTVVPAADSTTLTVSGSTGNATLDVLDYPDAPTRNGFSKLD